MSAEIIRPDFRPRPRDVLPALELIAIRPVQLDPKAWGFPDRETMERTWAEQDGDDAA